MDRTVGAQRLGALKENVGKVFVGAPRVLDHLLVGVLAGGHILIEDVPGVGKTTLARALATSLACDFRRIQFTPDLLPADVLGVSIFDPEQRGFRFLPGPVFANVVLADEINRTPPRTQSALLECMSERQVSIDGETRRIEPPFMVLATMNPIESFGTYELPESQMDRFLLRLTMGYPDREGERRIFRDQKEQHPLEGLGPVLDRSEVLGLQRLSRQTMVDPSLEDYALDLVIATRRHPEVILGASPRGTLALFRAAQALAFLDGRDYVLPDDLKEMAVPCLAHRLTVRSPERGGSEEVLREIVDRTEVPG